MTPLQSTIHNQDQIEASWKRTRRIVSANPEIYRADRHPKALAECDRAIANIKRLKTEARNEYAR